MMTDDDSELILPCSVPTEGYCSALVEWVSPSLAAARSPFEDNEAPTDPLLSKFDPLRISLRVIPLCSESNAQACESQRLLGGTNKCGKYLARIAEEMHEQNMIYPRSLSEIQRKILTLAATKESSATSTETL